MFSKNRLKQLRGSKSHPGRPAKRSDTRRKIFSKAIRQLTEAMGPRQLISPRRKRRPRPVNPFNHFHPNFILCKEKWKNLPAKIIN